MKILEAIGIPTDEREKVRNLYDDDIEGLRQYVLLCVALFDDRYEYMA